MKIQLSQILSAFISNRDTTGKRARRTRKALLEQFERREVFATLVDATRVTFQDVDGDNAQVVFSKPILRESNINSILKFDKGSVDGSNTQRQQLMEINLTSVLGAAASDISVSVVNPSNSSQVVNVGKILASGIDLGNVQISGDLRSITAGDAKVSTSGVGTLKVGSFGNQIKGTNTEFSSLKGGVGEFFVGGNFEKARLLIEGDAKLIQVGGSILGTEATSSGQISVSGNVEDVTVKQIVGGGGIDSGQLRVGGSVLAMNIYESLQGGSGLRSGSVRVNQAGRISSRDIIGSSGRESGSIHSTGDLETITVGRSIYGGVGMQSGSVLSDRNIDYVGVGDEIYGGQGTDSGEVLAVGNIGQVVVVGSIIGGFGIRSGNVQAIGNIDQVNVRDVFGGKGAFSGRLGSGKTINSLIMERDIVGGVGESSGQLTGQDIVAAVVKGSIKGGQGLNSGNLISFGKTQSLRMQGALMGGSGNRSGRVQIGGRIDSLLVHGGIVGGSGEYSGEILVSGNLDYSEIGSITGGDANFAGRLSVEGNLGILNVGGDVIGGNSRFGHSLMETGSIVAKRIDNLNIAGSIIAGTNLSSQAFKHNGSVRVANDIYSMYVQGEIRGNATHQVTISARGSESTSPGKDRAFVSVLVHGNVSFAQIIAGLDVAGNLVNEDAQIGTVTVQGYWFNADLVAGIAAGRDGKYGTADDAKPKSFTIKDDPSVISTIDSFFASSLKSPRGETGRSSIVAENVKKVWDSNKAQVLTPGAGNDFFTIPGTNTVVREWRP